MECFTLLCKTSASIHISFGRNTHSNFRSRLAMDPPLFLTPLAKTPTTTTTGTSVCESCHRTRGRKKFFLFFLIFRRFLVCQTYNTIGTLRASDGKFQVGRGIITISSCKVVIDIRRLACFAGSLSFQIDY